VNGLVLEPLEAAGLALLTFFFLVLIHSLKAKRWGFLIFLFGAYIFCDGMGSILMYLDQSMAEHIPRAMRMIAGVCLMWLERKVK